MTRILALDLGTKCGFAIDAHGSGVWNLSPGRFEGAGMRFVRFRRLLSEVLDGIDLVYFEEVRRHIGTDAAHIYGGLMAIVTEECELRKIPYAGIPVGTIKKHATGKGNADKTAMVEAARARFEHHTKIQDDNHADALWLLDYATQMNKKKAEAGPQSLGDRDE